LRIAVIGCGAIADAFHLPALLGRALGSTSVILVDPSTDRAAALARKHGLTETASNHRDVIGRVDAAIIASPHHTHVPIALDLLEAGIAVLSEKPLGTTVAEVQQVAAAATKSGLPVAVNLTRRFIPACREIHRLIHDGAIGTVTGVQIAEGDKFGWPAATPSMFGARSGGQGVLLDIGVHVLDLLTWWLGPDLKVDSYRDDSFGGSEAACDVRLTHGAAPVSVKLSWLAKQSNLYVIEGTAGTIRWSVYDLDVLTLQSSASDRVTRKRIPGAPSAYNDLAKDVIRDFSDAITKGTRPFVTPEDALPSMRLIEDSYARRQRFEMPWHAFQGGFADAR